MSHTKGELVPVHNMNAYVVVDTYNHAFLMSALDGRERPVSYTGCVSSKERLSNTQWIGSLVSPWTSLDIYKW